MLASNIASKWRQILAKFLNSRFRAYAYVSSSYFQDQGGAKESSATAGLESELNSLFDSLRGK